MKMPIPGSDVHLNVDAGDKKVAQHAAKVVAVHGPRCVTVISWNGGGTQSTSTSVMFGDQVGQWQWPDAYVSPKFERGEAAIAGGDATMTHRDRHGRVIAKQ